jgi:hypothetical protein
MGLKLVSEALQAFCQWHNLIVDVYLNGLSMYALPKVWATRPADRTVLTALQAAVGGRMRLFISGGAPLPPYAQNFMATAMNVPVLQARWGRVFKDESTNNVFLHLASVSGQQSVSIRLWLSACSPARR